LSKGHPAEFFAWQQPSVAGKKKNLLRLFPRVGLPSFFRTICEAGEARWTFTLAWHGSLGQLRRDLPSEHGGHFSCLRSTVSPESSVASKNLSERLSIWAEPTLLCVKIGQKAPPFLAALHFSSPAMLTRYIRCYNGKGLIHLSRLLTTLRDDLRKTYQYKFVISRTIKRGFGAGQLFHAKHSPYPFSVYGAEKPLPCPYPFNSPKGYTPKASLSILRDESALLIKRNFLAYYFSAPKAINQRLQFYRSAGCRFK
jgi:hypothetical protein